MVTIKHLYNNKVLPKLALFCAAFIWGSSFFVMKNTLDMFTPHILLGFRFTVAFIFLSIIFWRKLRDINFDYVCKSALIGLFLFLGCSTQAIGITGTSPGKSSFLTAVYCIFVPFLFWIIDKSRPDIYNYLSAVICLVGICMVSVKGEFSIGFGDSFTLIGGFFYAAHIVAIAKLSRGKDPIIITILQFGFVSIFSWVVGFWFESLPVQWHMENIAGLLYLAIFATAIGLLLQNIGQKYTHPSSAAIILSLESVFGVLFSVIFYGEHVTPRLALGFLLIFVSVIISETKLKLNKNYE